MANGKMNLGGAKLNDSNRADAKVALSKGKVQNVIPRPSGFPNKVGTEPIGSLSSSPLKMQGMKGNS
jgi:hypothetical protein